MKYFKANGLWYSGDDPSKSVAGSLRYSSSGLRLEVLGH